MPEALLPAWLLAGPEEGKKDEKLSAISAAIEAKNGEPPERHRFHAFETRMTDVVMALSNRSLFARHRLVLVEDAEQVRGKAEVEALAAWLAAPADDATLVLRTSAYPAEVDRAITARIPKTAQVIFWEMFESDKRGWIVNFFRQRKVALEPGVVDHILDMVTNNTRELGAECERLALYVGPGAVLDMERAEQYLYHTREENAFTLFDQLAARDHVGGQEVLSRILLSAESDPQQVASALLWQFGRLVRYRRLVDREHYNPEEAIGALQIRGKRNQATVQKAAKAYSAAEIDGIVTMLAELDARFRAGRTDLHPLMLQMAIHYITRSGGRGAWRDFAA
jgi:DNA polymerase-3 subunit delta